ncbi:MAG: enoyl-CoA hydratase [Burkholderiaceae bacterium]|nr:enoyl-CoA hydratase [Burkholderiaceae bacterium]
MTAASDPILLRSQLGSVLTLTLNRPDAGNSLSNAMIAALASALDAAADDDSVHVVVLAAAPGKVFCAGHDLKEFQANNSPSFSKAVTVKCSRMMQAIVALPKPVIAKVAGVATAAGAQLVAACDLAIAADTARFATPGVNIGLWCLTPMVAISRSIAPKHAMQMLLTGRLIDAQTALRFGLINEAVPPDQLDATVDALAAEIASKSSFTVALGKQAFYRQLGLDLASAYDYASEVAVRNMLAEDAAEGITAFTQKRPPVWKGR